MKEKKQKTWAKTIGDLAKILQINKLSLKQLKNNLFEVTVNGDTLQDLVILKTGVISPGKCTIKYTIIKLT